MKATERTTCPICNTEVAINPRNHTIRKHRLGGQKSEVCSGSHRIYLRPAHLEPTDYTVYAEGAEHPLLSTSDRDYAQEVARLIDGQVYDEWREHVVEAFNLPSAPAARIMWIYLPEHRVDWVFKQNIVRSRTCQNLVAIPLIGLRALSLLGKLDAAVQENYDEGDSTPFYAEEVKSALNAIRDHRRYVAPPRIEIPALLASAIITLALTGLERESDEVLRALWYILTHGALPPMTKDVSAPLCSLLSCAEHLVIHMRPERLRENLVALTDLQDTLRAWDLAIER